MDQFSLTFLLTGVVLTLAVLGVRPALARPDAALALGGGALAWFGAERVVGGGLAAAVALAAVVLLMAAQLFLSRTRS